MQVKICGITQLPQAKAIAQLGVAKLGFICVPQSPRYILPSQIRAIADELPLGVERIGVFVDASLAEIQQVVAEASLSGVQLHGSESPQFCQQIRKQLPSIRLIKAFRVRDAATLEQTLPYQTIVDALLLDAYTQASHPGLYGGTGHRIAPELLQSFCPDCSWFLAGGITPENLAEALQVRPNGIDVSSGVELAPGNKDLQKVAALMARLVERWGCEAR